MNGWPVALTLGALAVGFALGRSAAPASPNASSANAASSGTARPVAALSAVLPPSSAQGQASPQAPDDPRELIPVVPGSGDRPAPGSPQPRPGEGECTVLMFRDGQFYRMQPGPPPPGGTPRSGDGEVFPLQPLQPPPGLGTPLPDQPPFPAPELRS
ncbi:hypothetical protein [Deinococcus koreensis]|uniref:Uncharacterized protein n=1 Tax=Deinococcus koreensis TaxID=2054903 RepID=A0A2K3USC1_9DEIO|nr:hypothetical protein [Deinococcus koreensis]PNY79435.1 hypothetical protein CVO96_18515 [Deinococcus koreensis]